MENNFRKLEAEAMLRQYQVDGIAQLARQGGGLLADEPGLGKTAQAIVTAASLGVERILVICPATAKAVWAEQFAMWSNYDKPLVLGSKLPAELPQGIIVINYENVAKNIKKLFSYEPEMVICDESHYLKNPKAKRTKAILGGGKRYAGLQPRYKLLITGTPLTSKPIELFSQINWLRPDIWVDRHSFGCRYCQAREVDYGWGRRWEYPGADNLDELRDALKKYVMVRRLKADVLTELPPKIRQLIIVDPTREYKSIQREAEANPDYSKAVMAADEGVIGFIDEIAVERNRLAAAKAPIVARHVKDIIDSGSKVVLFAHHKECIRVLEEELALPSGAWVKITGDTPMPKREGLVSRFQNDPDCRLFIGNIQSAGTAITLTAASIVVFAELDWLPANLTQAEDRCHRIGQNDCVVVQHILVEGSLELAIAKKLLDKQRVLDTSLDISVEGWEMLQ